MYKLKAIFAVLANFRPRYKAVRGVAPREAERERGKERKDAEIGTWHDELGIKKSSGVGNLAVKPAAVSKPVQYQNAVSE